MGLTKLAQAGDPKSGGWPCHPGNNATRPSAFLRVANPSDTGEMRALSIRQPYAELILRGIKTAELRSRSTSIVGERFYIYACKKKLPVASGQLPVKAWSDDLRVGSPPEWMIELAEQVKLIEPESLRGAMLPGVIRRLKSPSHWLLLA